MMNHHNHSPEDPPLLMNHVNHNNNHSGLEYLKKNGKEKLAKATQPYERPRLVAKNGECLIKPMRLPNAYLVTYRNLFHLVIEYSWRRILAIFSCGFLLSWLTFGVCYYIIVYMSGDLQFEQEHKQCIANVHSFIGAFLFSLESQHTIGYGTRYMTEVCPPAFVILCVQLIVGVLLQTMLAGVVVAKVLRPKKRKQEMRFSRTAVVGPLDPESDKRPALMIRLADIQHRLYLAESHVRLYMASTRYNSRGEKELIGVKDMNVGYDLGWDRVLLLWPITVRHVIDEESPFFGMTQEACQSADFELIMTVEGIVEATGMTFQARTSFLPEEIQWGRRFLPMVHLNSKSGQYEVDYSLFEVTERADDFIPLVVTETADETADDERPLIHDGHEPLHHCASGFT